jgi:hypothetical protein
MAVISRHPNCVKRSLTQTAPKFHRSPKPATSPELSPRDRVEGLGNFGKPNGEFGTVERANEDDAVVKWDDDG